jgi:uncharacterized repeat protein (TIGR03803 family)
MATRLFALTIAGVLIAAPLGAQNHFDILHTFKGKGGIMPSAAPIHGSDGNYYGTTTKGGVANHGTVYRMTPAGEIQTVHAFSGPDGSQPLELIEVDGDLYGVTIAGGASNNGTIFRVPVSGNVTVVHSFDATNGRFPLAGLLLATDGSLYGTAKSGGASGKGVAFRITLDGTYEVVHAFAGGATDAANPQAALIQAADGNFYGTSE